MKILIPILVFFSVQVFAQNNKTYTINGHISGVTNDTKVYLFSVDDQLNIDSGIIDSGNFILKGKVDRPTLCWLRCNGEYAIIMLENTNMQFKSPLKDMHLFANATGGKEQSLHNELDEKRQPYNIIAYHAYDSLIAKQYRDSVHKKILISHVNNYQDTAQQIYINFGKSHPNSYVGLDILYRNRNSIGKETIQSLLSQMSSEILSSSKAKSLTFFAKDELAQKGGKMIDFKANDLQGNQFKLSSLKGKYILLSFWSMGCGPCRMENRNFSDNYQKFRNKIEIVSFSLDNNKEYWIEASKADNIKWTNVSDLEGETGKIKTQYNVQSIPASFLINPEGIIIESFIGFGDQFLKAIDKIIK
jgi:peroxiredoxin